MKNVEIALMQLLEMLEQNGQLHWWQKKQLLEILNAPPPPPPPVFNFGKCAVCGAQGVMGYVCPRPDCPSLARATS